MNFQMHNPPPPDPMLGFYKAQKSAQALGVYISLSTDLRSMIFSARIPVIDGNSLLASVSMSHKEFCELHRDEKEMWAVFETLAYHARAESLSRFKNL